jgi:hypothetical protein
MYESQILFQMHLRSRHTSVPMVILFLDSYMCACGRVLEVSAACRGKQHVPPKRGQHRQQQYSGTTQEHNLQQQFTTVKAENQK